MSDQDLAQQLLSRRPDAEDLISENKIVDDVLSGRTAIISRTSRKGDGAPGIVKTRFPANSEFAPVAGIPYPGALDESRYLPKRSLETTSEYQRRLEMTPFFPETPGILQSRQGALFRKPPDVSLPDSLRTLESKATCGGQSLLDVIVKVAEACQIGGFAGILVDRETLPEDVSGRVVSQAEASARQLGRVIIAPFAAHQIRDWGTDRYGLAWIKVVELHDGDDSTWDTKKKESYTVRVIDRQNISVWDLKRRARGDFKVTGPGVIPHGAVDAAGQAVVPFRLFNPFPARDSIGRSNLRASAEADVAATRMLSELLWLLHMMCPILTLTTNRPPEEIKDIGLGTSFLNVLQSATNAMSEEKLSYTQLDPTAADRLMKMYEQLCSKARDQANKSADAGVTGPVQQSGISKAWTFKTGEERVLFLLSVCLQEGFQWILETAARMSGSGDGAVAIKFPQNYDVTGIPEQIAIARESMDLFAPFGLNTAAVHVLEKAGMAVMGNPSSDEITRFKAELARLAAAKLHTDEQLAPISITERLSLGESDTI